jgi:hypothetical protein
MPDYLEGGSDEATEEQKRLDEARRRGGLPLGRPMPPAPPVSAPASSIGFTKGWSPEERAKQAAAQVKFLRDRGRY